MIAPSSTPDLVHVVDDDAAMRDSLRVLLESAGFAVRTHDSAKGLLAITPGPSGCVLTDVRMPEMDGLELQVRLKENDVRLPVIVMTGQGDISLAVRAMKAGAVDFLEKPFDETRLFAAVRAALDQSRQSYEQDTVAAAAAGRLALLTLRERQVFDLLVTGLSTKAIAQKLRASPRTIEVHRARVFEKLDARSLPDLVRLALATDAGMARHD